MLFKECKSASFGSPRHASGKIGESIHHAAAFGTFRIIDQVQIHLSTAHQCSSGSETGTHNVGSSKNCVGSVTLALVNTPCDAFGSNTATVASKKNARLLEYICLIANIHSGTP